MKASLEERIEAYGGGRSGFPREAIRQSFVPLVVLLPLVVVGWQKAFQGAGAEGAWYPDGRLRAAGSPP